MKTLLLFLAMISSSLPSSDVIATRDGDTMTAHFFGHGSVGFTSHGLTFYVDPVAPYADWASLPKADFILVSHEHGDHLDAAAIKALSKPTTVVLGNVTAIEALGYGAVLAYDKYHLAPFGVRIEAVPAYNTSPEKQNFHPKASLHNGYILTLGGSRVYVAGDSEPTPEMLALRDIDVAFLPVNLPYTMTEEQAASAVRAIRPTIFYPYHYGGTDHKTDLDKLARLIADTGVEMRVRPLE